MKQKRLSATWKVGNVGERTMVRRRTAVEPCIRVQQPRTWCIQEHAASELKVSKGDHIMSDCMLLCLTRVVFLLQ